MRLGKSLFHMRRCTLYSLLVKIGLQHFADPDQKRLNCFTNTNFPDLCLSSMDKPLELFLSPRLSQEWEEQWPRGWTPAFWPQPWPFAPAQARGYRFSPQCSPRIVIVPPTAVEGFLPHLNNGLISAPLFKIALFPSPSKSVKALSRALWGLGGGIIYIK